MNHKLFFILGPQHLYLRLEGPRDPYKKTENEQPSFIY